MLSDSLDPSILEIKLVDYALVKTYKNGGNKREVYSLPLWTTVLPLGPHHIPSSQTESFHSRPFQKYYIHLHDFEESKLSMNLSCKNYIHI